MRLRIALLGVALVASPAFALFDDDEARRQIAELRRAVSAQQQALDARVGSLESTMRSRSLIDLFTQVEALKGELAKLRGQIEVLNNEVDTTQRRQRDLYVDADTRLRALESDQTKFFTALQANEKLLKEAVEQIGKLKEAAKASEPAAAAAAPAATQAAPAAAAPAPAGPIVDIIAEQRVYDAAFAEFRAARYAEAANAFVLFLRQHPKSALAPSAQYWFGNSLYAKKDYKGAIAAQRALLVQYPDSTKVPDALLNIASAQHESGDAPAARRTLDEIVKKHPASEAAVKAKQRLASR